ncbi:MAG: hypothetical protein BGP10_15910 [Rhodanobacter sp. 68-29]|nr:TraR/DksA C4-type zinc finger protein [Rhodanobacter sp.]ODV27882.1 MAG: hypothetical protein ABT19_01485 [Rhodanobacter sp. SCN 68-63]OJY61391.1 MAG: hypothetical protein BGP10_15910 [Rhodanobacter sp. 68-29]
MDTIDLAQQRQMDDIDHALASRRKVGAGRSHCEQPDCGEPISDARKALGAVLCIDCQRDAERSAQRCARTAI